MSLNISNMCNMCEVNFSTVFLPFNASFCLYCFERHFVCSICDKPLTIHCIGSNQQFGDEFFCMICSVSQ